MNHANRLLSDRDTILVNIHAAAEELNRCLGIAHEQGLTPTLRCHFSEIGVGMGNGYSVKVSLKTIRQEPREMWIDLQDHFEGVIA